MTFIEREGHGSAMHRNKTLTSGVIAILALLLVGGLASQASTPTQQAADRAGSVGSARASSSDQLVMIINQEPVTAADLAEKRRLVETNLDYMRQEIGQGSLNKDFLVAFVELLEQYDPTTIAVAGLMAEQAMVHHAHEQGYAATLDEIATRTANEKEFVASESEAAVAAGAYIDAIGPDIYWQERFPAILRREIAIDKLWDATTAGIDDMSERKQEWTRLERSVVTNADIEITQPDVIHQDTIRAALAYLDRYWELTA